MSRLRAVLAAVAAASLLACGGSDGGSEPPPPVVALRVTPGTASLRMGETVQLAAGAVTADGTAGALPAGTAIAWASEDTTIAIVNATGQARAVRAGTVALRATAGTLTGATTATVRAATPQLATAARATARIGPAGGTVTATSGGRRYVLTVPAGALRDSTEISLTPLSGLTELPAGAGLVAGADFAPAGLRLAVPARLRVEGVTGIDARRVRGFAYARADGADFQRGAATLRGDTLVVPVTHFSGGGAVTTPDAAELAGVFPPFAQNDAGVSAYLALEDLARADRESGTFDVAALAELARRWYTDVVRPALQGAGSDPALVQAVGVYGTWQYVLECGGDLCPSTGSLHLWPNDVGAAIRAALAGTVDEARGALAAALKAGIARSNATCIADHELLAVKNVFYYQLLADYHGVATATNGLGRDAVLEGVCVRVVLETVSFPDTLAPGTAAPLRLTTGLSFGGAAPVHAPPVFVTVQATGATPGLDAALAGAAGSVELPFTPSGTGPVRLEIRAALAEHGLAAFGIVRDTTIERAVAAAVTLTPTAAILDRGATATFTATLTGVATTAVTWTATGGTFVVAGNTLTYTAGSTPGTFAVTARSVADPTRSASAPVTIVGPSGGATVAVVGLRGESIATVAAGAITCTIQDTVATAAGIPGAEETRADCTGAVGGAALATGSYVLGGGASAALTISGEARTSASAGATDGQVSTVTRLRIRFTVGPDEVRLDLTGRLEAAIPDPASNTDATALLQLSGPGGTTVLRQEVGSSVVAGWVPPMSLAESRRLGPGTYELTVVVGNEARNGALTPPAGGTAAATFTLTFSR